MSEQEAMKLAIGRTPIHDVTDYDLVEIWEAAMQWRDSQVAEPVAYLCEIDVQNFQGQSEFRTALFYRKDPAWHEGNLINEVISAIPLYTIPPAAQINQQLVRALEEMSKEYLVPNSEDNPLNNMVKAALAAAKETK